MLLWGRITGKDKRKQFPEQQGSVLKRKGDYTIISPYGLYADLPSETLTQELEPGRVISVTVKRPEDSEQGEPVFFHPETNTRIIARNNGDLDIETGDGGVAKVNILCTQANVTATESVTFDTPLATCTENVQINGNLTVDGNAIVIGSATVGSLQVNGISNGTGLATFGGVQINGTLSTTGAATLGGGGPAIARVGDSVVAGVITTGSGSHTAT